MMDDDIFDIESDGGSSDFVPEPAPVRFNLIPFFMSWEGILLIRRDLQKSKAKAAPKKAPAKSAPKKMTQTTLKAKPASKSAPAKKRTKADSEDEVSNSHLSDDDSLLSHTPPKAKKASAPKRAGSKPLADVENESFGADGQSDAAPKNGSASDKYQKVCFISGIYRISDGVFLIDTHFVAAYAT